jgi:hypothetical protein
MKAEPIAEALGGRKAGGGWMARCPAHDDRQPSLSIRDTDDGAKRAATALAQPPVPWPRPTLSRAACVVDHRRGCASS